MTAKRLNYSLGPFARGMDNRRPEFHLEGTDAEEGDRVRNAVNVDVTKPGTLRRRKGYSLKFSGACHSLWAHGDDAFIVRDGALARISGPAESPVLTTLRTGMSATQPLSYAATPRGVFWSDGQTLQRIVGNTSSPATLPTPPQPAAAGDGDASARFGLCLTYSGADGEEGPATVPIYFDGESGRLIHVSGLPGAFPVGVARLNVYLTHPNDTVMQRYASYSTPAATLSLVGRFVYGTTCLTLDTVPMPAGKIVRHHGGRLIVASGRTLYYSEPYMLGLLRPSHGFVQYPADITVVEPTSGGLWVCADQTYWYAGLDIASAKQSAALPYGGVAGSGGQVPNSNDVFWLSPRGLVVATQTGEVKNVQEETVAINPVGYGAALFREENGLKQFVESTFAPNQNRMAAASYMSAELIRRSDL